MSGINNGGEAATGSGRIRIWRTTRDSGERCTEETSTVPASEPRDAAIVVDPEAARQEIIGFGGAFTEAAAYTLSRRSPERRSEILDAYFHPETGSRYNLCRTHINSCDFALGNYAYNECEGDVALSRFDISRDRRWLIPTIRDARARAGEDLILFASPWSPPAWMKTNGMMNHGGSLKPECRAAWALYFSKYIRAYEETGIPMWGVTVQNEPDATQKWDSCRYTAEEERDFIRDHLGPRLEADGLGHVKIIAWDHNKDLILERTRTILRDPDAARRTAGIGFHWYAGDHFDRLEACRREFPGVFLLATEGCQEGGVKPGSRELGERYAHAVIGDMNHGAAGWVDWNMVLDPQGGPNHVANFCDAPIIADPDTDTVHYQSAYYALGHFSRFVRRGARRLELTAPPDPLEAAAFRNPDGSIVLVVLNRTDEDRSAPIAVGSRRFASDFSHRSLTTLVAA